MTMSIKAIYDQRREKNQRDLDNRIKDLYEKSPRIKEIDKRTRKINFERMQALISKQDVSELTKEFNQLKAEKASILQSLGYKEDYLEMKYHCDLCKDTGVHDGKTCTCKKKLLAQKLYDQSEIEERIAKENFQRFNPSIFRKSRQANEDISPYENIKIIYNNMQRYVHNFDKGSPSLYLYGNVGTGKTYMVNCVAKALMDKGVSVLYQSSNDLSDLLATYKFMNYQDKLQNKSKVDLVYNVDVLIIDDLGTENINDVTKSNLFEVINKRIVKNKSTIISSNIEIYDLEAFYDKRIFSRIVGEYTPVRFYGSDLRMV